MSYSYRPRAKQSWEVGDSVKVGFVSGLEVVAKVATKARAIIARGFAFECEVLRSGEASLTITDPEEGDLDIRIVMNGPDVRAAVEDLVTRFGLTGE